MGTELSVPLPDQAGSRQESVEGLSGSFAFASGNAGQGKEGERLVERAPERGRKSRGTAQLWGSLAPPRPPLRPSSLLHKLPRGESDMAHLCLTQT